MSAQQTTLPGMGGGREREKLGGGVKQALAYVLSEIDPETLPDDGWTEEVARRAEAYRDGRDGWRTGDIGSTLGEFAGGEGA